MVKVDQQTWKANYFVKLTNLLNEYPKILIVGVENVRSNQMQQIRLAIRGRAELLMGKNTMMRKVIRGMMVDNPKLEPLLKHVKGNIGFVFTKMDLAECRDLIVKNKVKAPAKAGSVAPISVTIPAGNTNMGPEKTAFFQALNINTKIVKGTIEIINDVSLVKAGSPVGVADAALLNLLGIMPFSYGLVVLQVYDNGSMYDPAILDIKESDIIDKFLGGVARVASLSLALNYPTVASVPHLVVNAFKNVLSVAVATDISFPKAEKAKAYLKDPSAFAVAAAPAAATAAPAAAAGGKAAAKEEAKPAKKEASDEDMGSMGLFD